MAPVLGETILPDRRGRVPGVRSLFRAGWVSETGSSPVCHGRVGRADISEDCGSFRADDTQISRLTEPGHLAPNMDLI